MTQVLVGETLNTEGVYLKGANASTSGLLTNGKPVDAGSAIILASNVAVLEKWSHRTLVSSLGPGGVIAFKVSADAFTGYGDIPAPGTGTTLQQWQEIYWGRNTARRFGPFFAILDNSAPGYTRAIMRTIVMQSDVTVTSGTAATLYWAITSSNDAASLNRGVYLAFARQASVAVGHSQITKTMTVDPAATGTLGQWPCRASAQYGSVQRYQLVPFYLWFGWLLVNNAQPTCSINSLSAYEVP